jgi:hypothetical protein
MTWYDELNDRQRAKLLAFALGYLHSHTSRPRESVSDYFTQKFSKRLLELLEMMAKDETILSEDGE